MMKASDPLPRYRGAWLLVGFLLAAMIFVGSLWPSLPEATASVPDKALHFMAYAVLAFLFAGAMEPRRWPRLALALVAFGATIELAQQFLTETRSGEWLDLVANTAGIAAGLVAARLVPGSWLRRVELALGLGAERS
jgi:VanZ family protein